MTLTLLALVLTLLPPEAASHHQAAMGHYTAGRHGEAETEFAAAYAALPDPVRDREDREGVLGSLRGVLLVMHLQTGSPAPLCRLQATLQAHLDTLPATPPGTPDPPERTVNRERLTEVTQQLAAFPADVCHADSQQPPESATSAKPAATPVTTEPAAPQTPPRPEVRPSLTPRLAPLPATADGPTSRQLRISGGVTAGLAGVLLGIMTYGIVDNHRQITGARAVDAAVVGRVITPDEIARLDDHVARARFSQNLAIGTGISSAIFAIISVAVLTVANHKTKQSSKTDMHRNRVLMAPWRVPAGVGVTLRLTLP